MVSTQTTSDAVTVTRGGLSENVINVLLDFEVKEVQKHQKPHAGLGTCGSRSFNMALLCRQLILFPLSLSGASNSEEAHRAEGVALPGLSRCSPGHQH